MPGRRKLLVAPNDARDNTAGGASHRPRKCQHLRPWMALIALSLHAVCRAAAQRVVDCGTTPTGATDLTETACLPPRANLNPDVRYFKVCASPPPATAPKKRVMPCRRNVRAPVTINSGRSRVLLSRLQISVGEAGADMVYTSLISPHNSTCTGASLVRGPFGSLASRTHAWARACAAVRVGSRLPAEGMCARSAVGSGVAVVVLWMCFMVAAQVLKATTSVRPRWRISSRTRYAHTRA